VPTPRPIVVFLVRPFDHVRPVHAVVSAPRWSYSVVTSTTSAPRSVLMRQRVFRPPALHRANVQVVTCYSVVVCAAEAATTSAYLPNASFARTGLFWFVRRFHAVVDHRTPVFGVVDHFVVVNSCTTVVLGQPPYHPVITCYQFQLIRSYTRPLLLFIICRHIRRVCFRIIINSIDLLFVVAFDTYFVICVIYCIVCRLLCNRAPYILLTLTCKTYWTAEYYIKLFYINHINRRRLFYVLH